MADYDIGEAFRSIEHELIASMTRNLSRHQAEELEQGYEWAQWQVMQLEALEEYRRRNASRMPAQFEQINDRIEQELKTSYNTAQAAQERQILSRVRNNIPEPIAAQTGTGAIQGEFFKTNDRKLDALIGATTNDMQKAEYAVLRHADDQYRRIIFNAQVYANTGAGTYEKAVDMATRDFLSAGINCIEYKDGRRVPIDAYAEMALRTANKRAYLQGEGEMRKKWGIHTVVMNKRTNACPKCAPFAGKVIVDDVWSGGTAEEAAEKGYLLMSECIKAGLYHPNCQDSHTTYFGDVLAEEERLEREEAAQGEDQTEAQQGNTPQRAITSRNDELLQSYTPQEQERNIELYNAEQRENYCERQVQRFERLEEFSLDPDNQREYRARKTEWKSKLADVKKTVAKLKKDVAIAAESGIIESELTEDEKAAINAYISSESYIINEKLRSGMPLTKEEKWLVDNLDSALEKLPKYNGTVYRSLDSSMIENLDEYWQVHSIENFVLYEAFTSSSIFVYDKDMDIQMVIKSKNGRDIRNFNPKESEILFGRDSMFQVTDVKSGVIYLEEV